MEEKESNIYHIFLLIKIKILNVQTRVDAEMQHQKQNGANKFAYLYVTFDSIKPINYALAHTPAKR